MSENPKLVELRAQAMKLPLTPGVYIMKNKHGEIIYIGKAKALKNRVSQYFGSQNGHQLKVRKMVENVDHFDYILVDSEFEALVLECSLIKQHMPKYNILLKDDKGYSYIKITRDDWGRMSACFRKDDDNADYLGPYTGGFSVRSIVDEAVKIYKLPTCNKVFPRDIGKGRPCLNYYISLCCGPCTGKVSLEEYRQYLLDAKDFITGNSSQTVKELHSQMEQASDNLEFELAAKLRDRINAINRVNSRQKVVSVEVKQQDIFAVAQSPDYACLTVLRFNEGRLFDSESFIFDESDDLPHLRHDLIVSYYSLGRAVPPRLSVDGEIESVDVLTQWLSEKAGRKVNISTPQRGEQAKLMSLCLSNASEKLSQHTGRRGKSAAATDELALLLGLSTSPQYIESYDISHTAGSDNVAGMVVFKNGEPFRSAYRRFSIKGFSGQDDYGSMREVLTRRLNRYVEEKDTGSGFGILPDLILLDGGQGQVNAVLPVIEAFGFDIPVFGMVKDGKHRTRAISNNGGEIAISSNRKAFTLVSNIQEEVHRFAISYHRAKHKSSMLGSSLTEIEGIGPKKASNLIKHFKTISAIKHASVKQLCEAPGIGKKDAEKILAFYNAKSDKN